VWAVELAEKGSLHYLVFECLAERTIALAQQVRMKDPKAGFDPLLAKRMRAVLPRRSRRSTPMGPPRSGRTRRRPFRRDRDRTGQAL
jgi:hypothetical protein